MLDSKILPLYETVYNETDLGIEDKILKSKVNFATLILVHIRREIFFAIYERYFIEERNPSKQKGLAERSKQGLIRFLRDFELLPNVLNIGIVNNFFNELVSSDLIDNDLASLNDLKRTLVEDYGASFTLFRFVYFIIKASLYIFSDPNNVPKRFREIHFTTDEKFYMLLERLEIS